MCTVQTRCADSSLTTTTKRPGTTPATTTSTTESPLVDTIETLRITIGDNMTLSSLASDESNYTYTMILTKAQLTANPIAGKRKKRSTEVVDPNQVYPLIEHMPSGCQYSKI